MPGAASLKAAAAKVKIKSHSRKAFKAPGRKHQNDGRAHFWLFVGSYTYSI